MPAGLPSPADFAPPPDAATDVRWAEAERAARPERVDGLRERMAGEGVDAYFGVRGEHMRYLTGLPFDEGEVTVAGHSGKFVVGPETVSPRRLALHDPGTPRDRRTPSSTRSSTTCSARGHGWSRRSGHVASRSRRR